MNSMCKKYEKKLAAFLDNELSTKESALVQNHLDSCEHCHSVLNRLVALDRVLETPLEPAANPYLLTRLKANMVGISAPLPSLTGFLEKTLVTAMLITGIVIGSLIGFSISETRAVAPATTQTIKSIPQNRELPELAKESLANQYIKLVNVEQ